MHRPVVSSMSARALARACVLAPLVASPALASPGASDAALAAPLTRATLVDAVVARNVTIRAAEERATASHLAARAEGAPPPPEIMGQVWQVPFSRPLDWNAQMIMIGVRQAIPAPGSLGAREAAREGEARTSDVEAAARTRILAQEAGHAFADYAEAARAHAVHREHLVVASRMLAAEEARQGAGGALVDVAQAELARAQGEADEAADAARVTSARQRLNALLARAPDAPLGPPVDEPPVQPTASLDALLVTARASRPELRAAASEADAKRLAVRAAEREATWPSFGVGAYYFPPTDAMPNHGYGFEASMSLPWLGGAADRRREAARADARAAATEAAGAHVAIDAEVSRAFAEATSAARRVQVLRDRALPAARRAYEATAAVLPSGGADLRALLAAHRAVVETESAIVLARAALDHALVDLEASVGAKVAAAPLPPYRPEPAAEEAGDDAH